MDFRGLKVAFAGSFSSITREEAAELVAQAGGTPVSRTGPDTDVVVVGDEPWPVREDGHLAANLERAREQLDSGRELEILAERDFLARIGGAAPEEPGAPTPLYTTRQLGRILRIPERRLRAWVRRGVLKPVRTEHRLDYFDFRQASEIQRLAELTGRGVSLATIRESLEELGRWFPGTESAIHRIDTLGGEQGLLVRLGPGRLAEPSGQLTFLFDDDEAPAGGAAAAPREDVATETDGPALAGAAPAGLAAVPLPSAEPGQPAGAPPARPRLVVIDGGAAAPVPAAPEDPPAAPPRTPRPVLPGQPSTADEWFEIALELEEAEHLEEATRAYREALMAGGPSAEISFNLGNALYSLGRLEEALSRFEQAVEIDPDYAEAWNNLASVHAQFEEWDDAIEYGRRAVELAPEFLDAHYNLAEAYHGAGRAPDARRHARVYLDSDPKSPWAIRLRENLGLAS